MTNKKPVLLPDYYGYERTVVEQRPIWVDGTPIPWMTYPAINYLNQLNIADRQIFEYGCGASTLYWARRARQIYTVEHDEEWCARTRGKVPANAEIMLASGMDYVRAVGLNAPHDIIVVDGRWRAECVIESHRFLKPGGMLILDNAERYPVLTEFLRERGLIQVDMIGLGPQNTYNWCTSFFLKRDFSFKPARSARPHAGPGMIDASDASGKHAANNRPTLY